uniref:NTR domain-containing protein n=1 Tax=Heterorhabditis bacteriophora TaxID=37862 RepID=A0A1I7XMS5_HETBA
MNPVSHVKVALRVTKQPMPVGSSRKGLNNIRYVVEHMHVYKKPSNISVLPSEIYTPSEPPACGLLIHSGKEYLLAGRIENSSLFTVLCGQVLLDNPSEDLFENVLEWKNVPVNLQQSLSTFHC